MKDHLKDILNKVHQGEISPDEALILFKDYPYQDLNFAKIDHHRELRKGLPEIIFGIGKTEDQIIKIAKEILKKDSNLLITKIEPSVYKNIKKHLPELNYNKQAKSVYLKKKKPIMGKGKIAIVTAGTSDIPVAEEAYVTCDLFGNEAYKIYDVGVAGIHRLFSEYKKLKESRIIITIAGMEGALPSVIAGFVSVPVIAVPTSIGYGASFNGLTALLAMLNACPGGISVVNIDNGFGAGYLASLINHM